MIISRTPYRISLFGGGTDYPAWYRQHGGTVLSVTINKYCYLTCRYLPPFFEHRFRVVYSRIEDCRSVGEIAHPAVRSILQFLKFERGLEIHHDGDLPGRSGMGSSSAFTVGLLNALYVLRGETPDKPRLARESIHVEQELLKETVGSQDQVCAAYGGLNLIQFHRDGEVEVQPVNLPEERLSELQEHLMLFYTGIKRTASDIAATYVNGIDAKEAQLKTMSRFVSEALAILREGGGMDAFGRLLHRSWESKRSLSDRVSNARVDQFYAKAIAAGALGGKLLGAGGGGFLLMFVPPDRRVAVRAALSDLIHVPFEFEFSGSQIIFADHEEDFEEQEKLRDQQPIAAFRELSGGSS